MEGEARGRLGDAREHQLTRDADADPAGLDLGAGRLQQRARLVVEKLQAELLDDALEQLALRGDERVRIVAEPERPAERLYRAGRLVPLPEDRSPDAVARVAAMRAICAEVTAPEAMMPIRRQASTIAARAGSMPRAAPSGVACAWRLC